MTENNDYLLKEFYFSYPAEQKRAREAISRLRAENNMSFEKLSSETSIGVKELEEMELGKRKISLFEFEKILVLFNQGVDPKKD